MSQNSDDVRIPHAQLFPWAKIRGFSRVDYDSGSCGSIQFTVLVAAFAHWINKEQAVRGHVAPCRDSNSCHLNEKVLQFLLVETVCSVEIKFPISKFPVSQQFLLVELVCSVEIKFPISLFLVLFGAPSVVPVSPVTRIKTKHRLFLLLVLLKCGTAGCGAGALTNEQRDTLRK